MTERSTIARLAPTPSGYLHAGNAANFVLNSWFVARTGGRLALRIDDMDATRARPQFVNDIFEVLAWLGVDWQLGPRDPHDFNAHFTMALHRERYRRGLDDLAAAGLPVFVCTCSRRELAGSLTCSAGCIRTSHEYRPGSSSVRVALPDVDVEVDGVVVNLRSAHGDAVLWRRDDLPAYHLVTVLEDADLGTTDVIRGADLLDSSALHHWLGRQLPGAFDIRYRHHALLIGPDGRKLSKSQGARSPIPRTDRELARITELAVRLGAPLGLTSDA